MVLVIQIGNSGFAFASRSPSLRHWHFISPPRVTPDCEKAELLIPNGEKSELRIEKAMGKDYQYFLEDFNEKTEVRNDVGPDD